jgi:hypothetical protein
MTNQKDYMDRKKRDRKVVKNQSMSRAAKRTWKGAGGIHRTKAIQKAMKDPTLRTQLKWSASKTEAVYENLSEIVSSILESKADLEEYKDILESVDLVLEFAWYLNQFQDEEIFEEGFEKDMEPYISQITEEEDLDEEDLDEEDLDEEDLDEDDEDISEFDILGEKLRQVANSSDRHAARLKAKLFRKTHKAQLKRARKKYLIKRKARGGKALGGEAASRNAKAWARTYKGRRGK